MLRNGLKLKARQRPREMLYFTGLPEIAIPVCEICTSPCGGV